MKFMPPLPDEIRQLIRDLFGIITVLVIGRNDHDAAAGNVCICLLYTSRCV